MPICEVWETIHIFCRVLRTSCHHPTHVSPM